MKKRELGILGNLLLRPREVLRTSVKLPQLVRHVVARYHVSPLWVVQRDASLPPADLCLKKHSGLGLFDPSLDSASLRGYLSKSGLKELQEKHNPAPWVPLVEDKAIFYRFCEVAGVPTPELYAIVYRKSAGWARTGVVQPNENAWRDFFLHQVPEEFVAKPAWGVYGRGLFVFRREGGTFIDHTAKRWDVRSLVRFLQADPSDRGYVVQERLLNEASLRNLSGTTGLQSVRVSTFVGDKGAEILCAQLKIIVGQNVIDNAMNGKLPNLRAEISLETGIVARPFHLNAYGTGFHYYDAHPDTHENFAGFAVPFWSQVCSVTRDTAAKFLPLRTVGWDVAICPTGPRIIEGNAWYDPPTSLQGKGIDRIEDLLRRSGG